MIYKSGVAQPFAVAKPEKQHGRFKQGMRANQLKNNYGITLATWNKMFTTQSGCCAICGSHQTKFTKILHVDHCHTTGKVRGLLCSHCNTLLGFAKDNIEILFGAMLYLVAFENSS